MRGPASLWAPVILGVLITVCGLHRAQAEEQPPHGGGVHTETDPFAEENRQLQSASDSTARRAAFKSILKKADELQRNPDPLLSVLRNKRPEEAYAELLEFLAGDENARRECFIPPLIMISNDPGDGARAARDIVIAYGHKAVPLVISLLASEEPSERQAAAAIAGRRVGGIAGAARMIPPLVAALDRNGNDLNQVIIRGLRRQTLLDFESPDQWRRWAEGKSEIDFIVEIADREAEARRNAETDRKRIEVALLEVLLDRMRREESENVEALSAHLRDSEYLAVRMEAATLLRGLIPRLDDEIAAGPISLAGSILLGSREPDELRRAAAGLLADSGRPQLAYPFIDEALANDGTPSELMLELVRGLNSPIAAGRLALLLEARVGVARERSGALLEAIIGQVRVVLEFEDQTAAGREIIRQLDTLLAMVGASVNGEIEAPARQRLTGLANLTCDVLVHLARLRRVDISACTASLVRLAAIESGVAGASITALRQGLHVPAARERIKEMLAEDALSSKLVGLYGRLLSGGEEAMLINLLGLYEDMAVAPEPVEVLRQRLLERARATEAVLPSRPDARRTVRDALRGLLAVVLTTPQEHTALVRELLETPYGEKDALGYLRVLPPSRAAILVPALQPLIERQPVRLALFVAELEPNLQPAELEDRDFAAFRAGLQAAAQTELGRRMAAAMTQGLNDNLREELAKLAGGALRNIWVRAAFEKLHDHPQSGEARDFLGNQLLGIARQAYPERYDNVRLSGLGADEFRQALENLRTRLKEDGFRLS